MQMQNQGTPATNTAPEQQRTQTTAYNNTTPIAVKPPHFIVHGYNEIFWLDDAANVFAFAKYLKSGHERICSIADINIVRLYIPLEYDSGLSSDKSFL